MLAVGANSAAIMAALPSKRTDLVLSPEGVQWAVNAYLVASAACIVLGGQAADRFGARLTSMVGLTLFGVASSIIASWHFAGPRGSLRGRLSNSARGVSRRPQLSMPLTVARLRALHRAEDIGSVLKGGVNVCQRHLVNEVLRPLVTEFVRNFGRKGATPIQRGSNAGLLGRVQALKLIRHNALRLLRAVPRPVGRLLSAGASLARALTFISATLRTSSMPFSMRSSARWAVGDRVEAARLRSFFRQSSPGANGPQPPNRHYRA
jgi:MFS family permease